MLKCQARPGKDTESSRNLFLVAEVNKRIVGFSRCEENKLKRTSHKDNKALELYKKYGFEVEGILKNDKILSDGDGKV